MLGQTYYITMTFIIGKQIHAELNNNNYYYSNKLITIKIIIITGNCML